MCVCVCVCDRQTDRQTETEKQTDRQTEGNPRIGREEGHTERDRDSPERERR